MFIQSLRTLSIVLMGFATLCISCAGKKLTKEQAKKQIDATLKAQKYTVSFDTKHHYDPQNGFGKMMIRNMEQLKEAGFIDYTFQSFTDGTCFDIIALDKLKPFITRTQKYPDGVYYDVSAGNPAADIISVNEPAPDGGNVVCNVLYKMKVDLNDFGTAIHYRVEDYLNSPDTSDQTARFIQTQDGWRLDK